MHDAPSAKELIEAVKSFLDKTAMVQLQGHAAFHARVASNALATVLREMEQRPAAEARERERLQALLNSKETDVSLLNRALCEEIRSKRVDLATPGLLTHLKSTTIDQLSVDQPGYSGLRTAAR
ncbi:conserved hypothetical protein [Hyphomonas neptunium ATCC 15444]|uniref:DUF6285 domain-containing protein n=2 Tax=Hyphomonas TaxID=85 RepID=Q0C0Q3_HYPNA|nr:MULTISPECIES: DUF6285 domain-containing protein [Hyphomonas]ABI78643.1 conserved hypothetical protein [Hyphomonas neptunium ATCC 15444]KCZ88255.1 hypothetical protein HHI_15174 [Hyphomonas hirschiana VP5]